VVEIITFLCAAKSALRGEKRREKRETAQQCALVAILRFVLHENEAKKCLKGLKVVV